MPNRQTEVNREVSVEIADIYHSLLEPMRYKVCYGGRGSGKSWTIARLLLIKAYNDPLRILCAREVQKSIQESVLELLAQQVEYLGLQNFYTIRKTEIVGMNGSRFFFEGLRTGITKIKSMEGIDIVWVEEADAVLYSSWNTLIPTIRKPKSEIWVSFNPADEIDDTYQRFIVNTPKNCTLIKANYDSNPWFPDELEEERKHLQETNEILYRHVWLGEPVANQDGAYYAKYIKVEQITEVPVEPALEINTYWDLGMSDSTAIWLVQRGAGQTRVVGCYENDGEGLKHYISWVREFAQKHNALLGRHYAPHDIAVRELGTGMSRLETARQLGLGFEVIPKLPLEDGIHAARQILPTLWFDKARCAEGLKALRSYRKEFDEKRGCFKTQPLHDWSSHYADAFRYFALTNRRISHEQRRTFQATTDFDIFD